MEPNQSVTSAQKQTMSARTKAALWLLIGPTGLLIVSFIGFAIINVILGEAIPDQDPSQNPNLFASTTPPLISTILNVVLFICGAVSVLTWLPGLIIGIVLLATAKPASPQV